MSGYSEGGASVTKKTMKAWVPRHYSAKSDIDLNLATLRDRAHDLATNSPVGAAAINVEASNVISSGLKLFPRIKADVLGLNSEAARSWSRQVKREFELWADNPLACDFQRRNNFYELQYVAFTSCLTDGDCFCLFKRRLPTAYNPYSLRLQLVEAARISNPNNVAAEMTYGENRIINGIEVNRDGALEAIWVSNRLMYEPSTIPELSWQRVKWYGEETGCRNLLHICRDVRPDQYRGVPLLAPVIESLKQISRYADAELTSAIIKSFFSIFFIQPQVNADVNQILGEEEIDVNDYKLGPATIAALPRGVDVRAIDSSNAQSTFDVFMTSFIKQVGAAIGIPAEVLLHTFNASYSASRAALLQAADEFRQRKAAFVTDFCKPIYELWLDEAVSTGRIVAPEYFSNPIKRRAWQAADWFAETSRAIDPLKEVNAMKLRLENGLSTYSKELAESSGLDFEDVIATLAQERKILAETNS